MKSPKHQNGLAFLPILAAIIFGIALLFVLYIWIMMSWSYSYGERAGWVQKLSKKGFICKTWEGEMAMVSLPGSMPEKFLFTIQGDETAAQVNTMMGKRVALTYQQHIGLPTSCFGETEYFVKAAAVVQDGPSPITIQAIPGTASTSPTPQAPPMPLSTLPAPPAPSVSPTPPTPPAAK